MNWPSALSIAMNWPDEDLSDEDFDNMITYYKNALDDEHFDVEPQFRF